MESYLIQGSDAWKELRKQFITSTDCSVIMGVNLWKTPYQLYLQKMDLSPTDKENDAMRIGTFLEPIARDWLLHEYNIICEPKVLFKGFMMASLDGLSECGKFIVEIKCGKKAFEQASNGEIPEYYLYQMMHQMAVCDLDLVKYVCFNGVTGIVMDVLRDDKLIKEMIKKEEEFYQCLLQYTPPPLTEKDYQQRNDSTWISLSQKYKNTSQRLKILEEEEKELRKRLIELSGGSPSMGAGIKLSKIVKKGNIDYKEIPELKSVNLDMYRKESSEYWKVMVDQS